MIEATSGHRLWSEQIDGVPADTFNLQDDVTKRVVASVQTQVILNEGKALAEARKWRGAHPAVGAILAALPEL